MTGCAQVALSATVYLDRPPARQLFGPVFWRNKITGGAIPMWPPPLRVILCETSQRHSQEKADLADSYKD